MLEGILGIIWFSPCIFLDEKAENKKEWKVCLKSHGCQGFWFEARLFPKPLGWSQNSNRKLSRHMHTWTRGHRYTDLSATLFIDGASFSSRYYSWMELILISCLQSRNVNSVAEIYPNTWIGLPRPSSSPCSCQMGGRRLTINVTGLLGWLSSQWNDRGREMWLQWESSSHSPILSLFGSELKCSWWLEGDPKGNLSLLSTS